MGWKHEIGRRVIPRLPVSRFAFDLFRHEFNSLRSRIGWRVLPWRIAQRRQLRQLAGVYLNLGSGG
jgi:hypothetical protein